ncbi:MAG TPA: AsmA family protein [Rhodocyclaceae bacterium]|nr:AsmA family protein [Rhodocyclaceae bacterium]
MATSKWKNRARLIAAILIAALLLWALFFDWDWLRQPLQRFASNKTERAVTLGHLVVHLAWPPVVRLKQVRIGNMQGGSQPQMISADEIDLAIDIPSLFGNAIVLRNVRLQHPDIYLERLANGRKNWTFGKPSEPSKGTVNVRGLQIDNGRIHYADAMLDIDVDVNAATGPPARTDTDVHRSLTTQLSFGGHYGKVSFDGKASTASILSLQDTAKPFAVLTQFNLDKTNVSADGSIADMFGQRAIDAQLAVSGPDLAALYPALAVSLPSTPPYRIAGHFTEHDKNFSYHDFNGKIGKSDIAGDATFTSRSPRPILQAKLHSNFFDLADLGTMIGVSPSQSPSPGIASKPVETAMQSKPTSPRRVLPQKPFKLDRLNAMDATVALDIRQLRVPNEIPFENLSASISLSAGRLLLKPLKLGLAGGDLVSTIDIDGSQSPVKINTDVIMRHAKLAQLFPTIKIMSSSSGVVGINIHLNGSGNSIAGYLANASGKAQLAMTGGTVSNLLMEEIGLDGGEIIKFLVRGDQTTPIRCAVASLNVNEGVARTEALVFDTGDTRVDGSGYVDMRNEYFDLLMRPEPKDRSILALRVPIRLYGNFAAPRYMVDRKDLLIRGGATIALGIVNPFAALLPLIETGPGTNSNCAALLQEVHTAAIASHAK